MKQLPKQFQSEPFSCKEIINAEPVTLTQPQYLKATDGIHLAYYHIQPNKQTVASIILIHGAGAHGYLPDYQRIGYKLSEQYNIEKYLLDLRGHGNIP